MIRPMLGLLAATFLVPWASPGLAHSTGTTTMLASWYGEYFHQRTTANGETYDMYGLTAASKDLPFNQQLRVCYRSCITVRINDRGPFVGGRELDLSYGAAKAIGMVDVGVADVEVTFL